MILNHRAFPRRRQLETSDFEILAGLLKQRTGKVLPAGKGYLIETRLMPLARKRSLDGPGAVIDAIRAGHDGELVREVIEALSTGESFFFRDRPLFDRLRSEVLPRLRIERAQARHLRIWSAACSSGQEPYSLAMLLSELAPEFAGWQVDILATDVSRDSLERARTGRYSQFNVQRGLPIRFLLKYFEPDGDTHWRIEEAIRQRITFREASLLDDFASFGAFDLILCRNILVDFDAAAMRSTLDRMAGALRAGGFLFLGGAESVVGVSDRFEPIDDLAGFYGHAGAPDTAPPEQIGQTSAG